MAMLNNQMVIPNSVFYVSLFIALDFHHAQLNLHVHDSVHDSLDPYRPMKITPRSQLLELALVFCL